MADSNKLSEEDRKKRLLCYASRGPGPAVVNLPPLVGYNNHDSTKTRGPAYSLGLKLKSSLQVNNARIPGPQYLIKTGLTAKGPYSSPAYTLRPRTKIFGDINRAGPGPAAYLPEVNANRRRPPAYSLSSRHKLIERGQQSPGPIYMLPPALGPKVPDKNAAAECSIKGRWRGNKGKGPSPGFYDIGKAGMRNNGAFSIVGRKEYKLKTYEAGPATYNLQNTIAKIRPAPPAFSLGIRHSECSGTLMTSCDKADLNDNCGCGDEK